MAQATVSEVARKSALFRGKRSLLSPQLAYFESSQSESPDALKQSSNRFRIVLNVSYLKMSEVTITFPEENLLHVEVKHEFRKDNNSASFSRDCIYRYEIPASVAAKELYALWTADNYLLIQCSSDPAKDLRREATSLVPTKVTKIFKPIMEPEVVKEMLEDIRDKAVFTLRYLRQETNMNPDIDSDSEQDKDIQTLKEKYTEDGLLGDDVEELTSQIKEAFVQKINISDKFTIKSVLEESKRDNLMALMAEAASRDKFLSVLDESSRQKILEVPSEDGKYFSTDK